MLLDLSLIIRLIRGSLREACSDGLGAGIRRGFLLGGLASTYVVHQGVNAAGFLLDDLLFGRYRQIDVKAPLFIVGPPRSGTTFLHRLLARDPSFTSIRLWEILSAPSIFQKKAFLLAGKLDSLLGGPAARATKAFERRHFKNAMHQGDLFEPEEDELMLLHILSSGLFLRFLFPFDNELMPLVLFDTALPAPRRRKIMGFYKGIVQRHLYVFGPERRFLSKNPAFSTKIQSLLELFPDAKFVMLVRNPLETVPSSLSLRAFFGRRLGTSLDRGPIVESQLRVLKEFYTYPLKCFEKLPEDRWVTVLYHHLVRDPVGTVRGVYQRLGLPLSRVFTRTLQKEASKARSYRTSHQYDLERFGLSKDVIMERFGDVMERFGFDAPGSSGS